MKIRYLLLSILSAILLMAGPAYSGVGNVDIRLNGGSDVLIPGQNNTIEIWITNSEPLMAMTLGFRIDCWVSSVSPNWVTPYGDKPSGGPFYIKEYGDAVGAFEVTMGVNMTNKLNNVSPDTSYDRWGGIYLTSAGPFRTHQTI